MVTCMANGVTTNTLEPRRNVRKNVKYVIAPFLFYKATAASCLLSFLPQPIIFLIVDTMSYHIERLTVRTPCTILRKIHVNLRNGKEKSSLRMCQLFWLSQNLMIAAQEKIAQAHKNTEFCPCDFSARTKVTSYMLQQQHSWSSNARFIIAPWIL